MIVLAPSRPTGRLESIKMTTFGKLSLQFERAPSGRYVQVANPLVAIEAACPLGNVCIPQFEPKRGIVGSIYRFDIALRARDAL